jgi:hypothetical protein
MSDLAIIGAGAIEIGGEFGLPEPRWPALPYDPHPANGAGGMEPVSVKGHVGNVARIRPMLTDLTWAEPLPAGGWVRWYLDGNQNVPPSELLHYAETLQPGPPTDELIPPTYVAPR